MQAGRDLGGRTAAGFPPCYFLCQGRAAVSKTTSHGSSRGGGSRSAIVGSYAPSAK